MDNDGVRALAACLQAQLKPRSGPSPLVPTIVAAILAARDPSLSARQACRLVVDLDEASAHSRVAKLVRKVRPLLATDGELSVCDQRTQTVPHLACIQPPILPHQQLPLLQPPLIRPPSTHQPARQPSSLLQQQPIQQFKPAQGRPASISQPPSQLQQPLLHLPSSAHLPPLPPRLPPGSSSITVAARKVVMEERHRLQQRSYEQRRPKRTRPSRAAKWRAWTARSYPALHVQHGNALPAGWKAWLVPEGQQHAGRTMYIYESRSTARVSGRGRVTQWEKPTRPYWGGVSV